MVFDGVFEGGGVKGIALIGALKRLEWPAARDFGGHPSTGSG